MIGPALARSHLGVSEIITTLMLVYVAIRVVEWLQVGPWKDPESFGFARIKEVPDQASLPVLFGRVNIGAIIALGLLVVFSLAVSRTAWGYELRLAGSSPDTARYAGISLRRKVLTALLLSGGIAGLAGAVQLTGTEVRLTPGLSSGFGFSGIIVAALAFMRPSGVAVAAFVAYYGTILAERVGLDPDTYGIPLVTSTMDLVGALTLVAALAALGIL